MYISFSIYIPTALQSLHSYCPTVFSFESIQGKIAHQACIILLTQQGSHYVG